MNFELTSDHEHFRQSIIAFAQRELNSGAETREQEGRFSRETWNSCAAQGLTALMCGSTHGGANLDPFETALAMEALGFGCTDGGLSFSIGAHLFAGVVPVWLAGTEEQKNKYLPRFASGEWIIANAMTEASSGSDAFSLKTTAVKTDGGYLLNGVKSFCTNAPLADVILVYAATDPQKGFFGGISAFLLDKNKHRFTVGPVQEKMGLNSSPLAEVQFNDLFVEDTQLLGKAGGGAQLFNQSMDWERCGLAALHVGTMQRLAEQSAAYAKAREVNAQAISGFQAVAFRLADMYTRTEAARLLAHKAAFAIAAKRNATAAAAQAKIFASEALITTAQDALTIHGGNGYMKSYGIERALRDAMASSIYSGTNDVLRNVVAGWLE